MMAAQCSDVLWIRSSVSLVFFVITAHGAKNGMLVISLGCSSAVIWKYIRKK